MARVAAPEANPNGRRLYVREKISGSFKFVAIGWIDETVIFENTSLKLSMESDADSTLTTQVNFKKAIEEF